MLSIADLSLYKVRNGQQPARLRKGHVAQKTTKNGVIFCEFMQTIQRFNIMHIQSPKTKKQDIAIDFRDHPEIGL